MEEEGVPVRRFREPPSPAEFASVEDANVPAIFEGCVRSWPACRLWEPSTGGLERLKHLAGPAAVEVMASTSGSNFYGDIRGHQRVPLQFHSFLDLAHRSTTETVPNLDPEFAFLENSQHMRLYLAQAAIFSLESPSPAPLRALMDDIATPSFLPSPLSAVNLWMSVNGSRSSTHYDPFHNLLCVISGCKQVKLWPPSAAPSLYPLPIFGEASNHSGVDFANPNFTLHPRFRSAMASFQSVTLHSGDALFLPEGWYHQVDSDAVTIAVNLWWPSKISLKLGSHMDAYLLRRLLANLLDSEKDNIIAEFTRSVSRDPTVDGGSSSLETEALRTLILCVSGNTSDGPETVARVFSSLDAASLQRTLLVMSVEYPRTLEGLILHELSPLACEILTRKFEEMDGASDLDCPQEKFYAQIYSVFDDPGLAMVALVDGKESLAAMALQRVLDGHLGLSCTLPAGPL